MITDLSINSFMYSCVDLNFVIWLIVAFVFFRVSLSPTSILIVFSLMKVTWEMM